MAARTLANLGLKAFFALGEDGWNDEIDTNFLKLSTLVQGGIINIVTILPTSPSQNDVYLLSNVSSNNPNSIAVYDDSIWKYFFPIRGWTLYNRSNDSFLTYTGTIWETMPLAKIRSLGSMDNSIGIIEQVSDNNFAKRAIGSEFPTSILSRSDGDIRYSLSNHTHANIGVSSFNTRIGNIVLSSSDISTAIGYTPMASSTILQGISGLDNTSGIFEQTGSNTFAKRGIGVSSPNDILSRGFADYRYQPIASQLTGISSVNSDLGVLEQYAPAAFRIRRIGGINNDELMTRGMADSLYSAIGGINFTNLPDTPDTYVNKHGYHLTVNSPENGLEFEAPRQVSISTVTSTNKILAITDSGKHIIVNNSSNINVTVPSNFSVPFPIGTTISLVQHNNGKIIISPEDYQVAIDFKNGFMNNSSGPHTVITLIKYNQNSWTLYGDLASAIITNTADTLIIEADNNVIRADAI